MNFGIIAAGEGSRLASEGVSYPKPLVPILGTPMIGRLIDIFTALDAGRIGIVVNDRMPDVAEYVRARAAASSIPIDVCVKSTPSSMHTFRELATLLAPYGRFITTTVDTIFRPEDFARYVAAFSAAPEGVNGMMALTSYIDDEKPLYVATSGDMRISDFLDTPVPGIKYISGGIYGLDESAMPVLDGCLEAGQSRMRNFQRALVHTGLNIHGYDMGKIVDVDHASDIAVAEIFLSNQEAYS